MVSRMPILQTCNVVVVLKAEDWLRSNICAVLRCKHLLDTEVSILDSLMFCNQKHRVSMCFVRCLAPNRSVKELIHRRIVHFVFQSSLEFPDLGTSPFATA